jgi:Mobilization protein NikA
MSNSRNSPSQNSSPPASDPVRPGLRNKTIATRLTPEELHEVESAVERDGKSLAEWVREVALRSARERPADPIELLLSELLAIRYALLNLFHATALAGVEGKQLLPDSVLKIRDQADAQKLQKARKLLQDFFAHEGTAGEKKA